MKRKYCRAGQIAILFGIGLFCASVLQSQQSNAEPSMNSPHITVTPQDMKWEACPPQIPAGAHCAVIQGDVKAANALFALRVKMPDNYVVPPHFHPADEQVVVISGVYNVGMGDKEDKISSRPMAAGSFIVMPKEVHHFVWAKGETIVQVYAIGPWGLTYVNPKDDPRNQ